MSWQPSADFNVLRERARMIQSIRAFFIARDVLEVETPLMHDSTVTDPHVLGIPAIFKESGSPQEKILYLQTSPEYAMKRLLAAGSGAIFQICKAFRQSDLGKLHHPEFTMLEWYRPGFDHHDLMDEMDSLLQALLETSAAERISYQELFEKVVGVNPHTASTSDLKTAINQKNSSEFQFDFSDRNTCLDLLFTHCIQPHLGKTVPLFIYDFPITQSALAKIRSEENPPVASRFEVYFKGLELANGFHELQDAKEQRARFEKDLLTRKEMGIHSVPIDENFLAALEAGLPDCAGVALGIDRLLMLKTGVDSLNSTLSFHLS